MRHGLARRRVAGALAGALFLSGCASLIAARAQAAADNANPAVFQILTMSLSDGSAIEGGTAFFVAPDGTALTNSHVVYFANHDPAHYRLAAMYKGEFYAVNVVCASMIEAPRLSGVQPRRAMGRDIAEIKLAPWRAPSWPSIQFQDGPGFTEHLGPLPRFPALPLGQDPPLETRVRVTGYGLIQERMKLKPWEQWTTQGVVTDVEPAKDGTPLVLVSSLKAPRQGNSGSPILDAGGRVVGIVAWTIPNNFALSVGIASSALKEPCTP